MDFMAATALALLATTRVTAIWTDMVGCTADRKAMEASVATALEPLRVAVVWRTGRPFEAAGPGTIRVVVLRSRASALDPATMGSSNPGSPSPTVWVQYDTVLRALGIAAPTDVEPRALGVALGRVIAHELVHLLAPGREHDRTGLFAPRLGARALLAPTTRLSPSLVGWYRARAAEEWLGGEASLAARIPSVTSEVEAGTR
jgi:hypothetical protein